MHRGVPVLSIFERVVLGLSLVSMLNDHISVVYDIDSERAQNFANANLFIFFKKKFSVFLKPQI